MFVTDILKAVILNEINWTKTHCVVMSVSLIISNALPIIFFHNTTLTFYVTMLTLFKQVSTITV